MIKLYPIPFTGLFGVCRPTGENSIKLNLSNFPDGTPIIKFENVTYKTVGFCYCVEWDFDNLGEFFTISAITDKLRSLGIGEIELYMPYIPNARQDRVKNEEDVFTLKTFANEINAKRFARVIVKNAHSNVALALLNNVIDLGIANDIEEVKNLTKFDTVFYPDEGATKRYAETQNLKDFPVVFGIKKRDWKTGTIKGLEVNGDEVDIKGKDILIVDDICSKGGTFKYSAIELKKLGAGKIYLYVTHCENVIDIDALKEAGIERVFTTNSIYRGNNEFITIINKDEENA